MGVKAERKLNSFDCKFAQERYLLVILIDKILAFCKISSYSDLDRVMPNDT